MARALTSAAAWPRFLSAALQELLHTRPHDPVRWLADAAERASGQLPTDVLMAHLREHRWLDDGCSIVALLRHAVLPSDRPAAHGAPAVQSFTLVYADNVRELLAAPLRNCVLKTLGEHVSQQYSTKQSPRQTAHKGIEVAGVSVQLHALEAREFCRLLGKGNPGACSSLLELRQTLAYPSSADADAWRALQRGAAHALTLQSHWYGLACVGQARGALQRMDGGKRKGKKANKPAGKDDAEPCGPQPEPQPPEGAAFTLAWWESYDELRALVLDAMAVLLRTARAHYGE